MANITPVFEDFVHDGWEPKHDTVTKALIGVHRGTLEIGMDVGIGTLEIGWPHVENLFTHIEERTRVLAMVDHRLARRGFKRLTDYACQPLTIPTRDHWAPKWRANVFRDLFNPSVHNQTLSTSAQVHVDVSHDEVIPVLEMFLSLSPIFIALNANSPVWGGRLDPEGMLAARQHFWYRFTKEHGYWNNVLCGSPSNDHGHQTERAPQSFEELASFISASKFLVHVHNGQIENPCLSFESWVTSNDRKLSDDEFREAFCNHEGTLWWDARPRIPYGTIEVRPMCQNAEVWASHALVLGLVENLNAVMCFMRQTESYLGWREIQADAIRNGLRGRDIQRIAAQVIAYAQTGLRQRGLHEEDLLEPLIKRIRDATSPGHTKKDIFESKGMSALLEHLMC